MKILSIETSCDETAMALVEARGGLKNPRFKILKNLVASQIKIHQPFGGVVPNLAKREHLKNLPILFSKIFNLRTSDVLSIDLIAVTAGPGLEPCLWTGIGFAKDLAKKMKKPLLGVNHLEGHLYSFLLQQKRINSKFQILPIRKANRGSSIPQSGIGTNSKIFPAVALIVSGGHTILLLMKDLTHYKKLGETRDDAAGEAFDKVARLLALPYPGGPELEKLAVSGNPNSISFPRPMIYQKNYDFSFSGLKTAVLYYLKNLSIKQLTNSRIHELKNQSAKSVNSLINNKLIADIAASFQKAVIDVLIAKPFRAAREFSAKGATPAGGQGSAFGGKVKSILLSGGVANNKALRKAFREESKKNKVNFFAPSLKFTTDNAAMTAVAAYFSHLKKKKSRLIAQPNLTL